MKRRLSPLAEWKGQQELVALHLARATEELEIARAHAFMANIPPRVFDGMIRQQYALRNDPNRSLEVH